MDQLTASPPNGRAGPGRCRPPLGRAGAAAGLRSAQLGALRRLHTARRPYQEGAIALQARLGVQPKALLQTRRGLQATVRIDRIRVQGRM